ncbi:YebC-like protein [Irpex rosettiformis]|uniref:YebC-like protein n=1 Tax=Irpex rosettiformis TaxID=378272 RepID=A0ACB8TTX2_9APHY|nr:YebC-like protein [Irpex rosettiformis]
MPIARPLSTSSALLSGHNKWSKIKGQKAVTDAQKSALYGKAVKDIAVAARQGGSADPETNFALAAVIKRARSQGVPRDNIDKALKKAAGAKDSGEQPVTYEAMAGTVGLIIECSTNNANRTATQIREQLNRNNARLAPVMFLFERKGIVRISLDEADDFDAKLERVADAALDAGAEDFENDEPSEGIVEVEFKCDPATLSKVTTAVTAPGLAKELLGSEVIYAPVDKADIQDEELTNKVSTLVDSLEELEDTMNVWTTLD